MPIYSATYLLYCKTCSYTIINIKNFFILIILRIFKKSFFLEKKVARCKCGESAIITEGLKLIIFSYKWGKCVKAVGKYLLESLAI